MNRKTTSRSFLLLFGLAVLHVFVFPAALGSELFPIPRWKVPVSQEVEAASGVDRGEVFPFRLRDRFGYIDPEGRILYSDFVLFDVALDQDRFINFPRMVRSLNVRDAGGRLWRTLPAGGYPILRADRILQLSPDRSGLSEWDIDGNRLWSRSFATLITDLRVTADAVLVGLLEGRVLLLDRQGRVALDFAPGGSRIQAVYGCAVSPDGKRIGIVSGLDPQRLVLIEHRQENWKPVYQESLPGECRRRAYIAFSSDGEVLLWEGQQSVETLEMESFRRRSLEHDGRLLSVVAGKQDGYAAILTDGNDGRIGIHLVSFPETAYFTARFPGSSLFLRSEDDAYFMEIDDGICRFDLEEG